MSLKTTGTYKYVRQGGKSVFEHRVVLHTIDPRPDEDELVVHHVDGNRGNNDPSNLVWMTRDEHSRLHHLGDNHFPCACENNANYRHGQCVGGHSKEYKKRANHKSYLAHRDERLTQQNEYDAAHREHKRWYDKVRHWTRALEKAETQARKAECLARLAQLEKERSA